MSDNEKRDYLLPNKIYDVLKQLVQLVLPALGALYFALAQTWGLDYGEEVVGTIAAFATFGGVLLGLSSRSYNHSEGKYDGAVEVRNQVVDGAEIKTYSLLLNDDPENLDSKNELTFRVDS